MVSLPFVAFAQENSPYSRYGVGNIVPAANLLNRGIGGISAGYSDVQSVNFLNPASYGNLVYTTLDLGLAVDSRTIKSITPQSKFTANNAIMSYVNIGLPLMNPQRAFQKKRGWGLNFGLRPITKVNYKIQKRSRISNIDSLATIYEGSGGINEAFVGTGLRFKNLNVGVNIGYLFGNKDYSTRLVFINDTIEYLASNSASKTNFGGLSINAGVQYTDTLGKLPTSPILRIGAYGKLQQSFTASMDVTRESFSYNITTGNPDKLDSIYESNGQKGKVILPSTFGVGFTIESEHLLYGLDFETSNWNNYRFYGEKDFVKTNWAIKAGIQFLPATKQSKKYWDYVKYRAGLYLGPDYINLGKKLPQYGLTLGAGFPLKLRRNFYESQSSIMNLAIEYGSRGNKENNIHENILRVGLGFSLSDIWFRRYKYD